MNLKIISNADVLAHYKKLGILKEWEWVKDLVQKMWSEAISLLIDGNNRLKRWKQPALSINHNDTLISNPREAYARANRSVTRMFDIPSESTTIKSINEWGFTWEHGWSFSLPDNIPAKISDQVLYYGKGIGYPVRGLIIDGKEAFYKTEEE